MNAADAHPEPARAESRGAVVISIDFEMRWGMHHVLGQDPDAYRESLRRAPLVVDGLLREFAARGIRATWATVGAIACDGWDEYWDRAPATPRYHDRSLAVTKRSERLDPRGELHFSRRTVEAIAGTAGQDLGCHTFSHALCRRRGATCQDLRADLAACAAIWRDKLGAAPTSFVFPCNEVCHVDELVAAGYRVARAPSSDLRSSPTRLGRISRLLADSRPPADQPPPTGATGLRWTAGSAFVRFNLPPLAWDVHAGLLRLGLRRLRPGRLVHLWWHPHNLGHDPERCLSRLRPLLDDISAGLQEGRLRSLNMSDLGV